MATSKKKSNKKPTKKPASPPFWEIVSIPRPAALPKDFASTPKQKQEVKIYKDYFDVTIDNLAPSSLNKIVFAWKFTDGTTGPWSTAYTLVTSADTPLQPTGFEVKRALGGVVVSWNGSYSSGTFFSEFKAIKIYAGTSATATTGTYAYVGQLTADRTNNSLFIPVDKTDTYPNGQYVRYGEYVYIHASSINQGNIESAIAANVASVSNGAGRATDADINDGAVVIEKLAANVLTVDNIKAGTINSTSYIRAGVKNQTTGAGGRIEIASNTVEDGTYDILPGITIYNTGGTQIFRADLNGNLTIGGYQPAGNYIGAGGAANDVNSNTTTISGNKIRTGLVQSNGYSGVTDGSNFSTTGTTINLTDGTITAQNFRINSSGSIFIKGTFTSGSSTQYISLYPYGTGARIDFASGAAYDVGYIASSEFGSTNLRIQAPKKTSISGQPGYLYLYGQDTSQDGQATIGAGSVKIDINNSNSGVVYINRSSGAGTGLNTLAVRNIYVSSTAGEPTVTGSDGDIKLEW